MAEQEIHNCDICPAENVPVSRKYYYYNIKCNCCNNRDDSHFEIIRHCSNCEPKPPRRISAVMDVIN